MFRLRTLSLTAALLALLAVAPNSVGDDKPTTDPKAKPDPKEDIMKRKLALAQQLLEGLTMEDFKKLDTAAGDLVTVRQQAAFMLSKTAKYELYANDFQKHLEEIQRAAKKKSVEAASLAYVEMTLTCVRCHQYVRDEKIGAAPTFRLDAFAKKSDR